VSLAGTNTQLMSNAERRLHLDQKAEIEKNADSIVTLKERGPLEFRPQFAKTVY
jgi:hypothetical protein